MELDNQQRSFELRLAWLAGIIDGEGTISLASKYSKTSRSDNYHFRPEVKVTNTNNFIIQEIKDIFDALRFPYYVSVKSEQRNWNSATQIKIEGIKRCKPVLELLQNILIGKRDVCVKVLEFINSRLSQPHKSPISFKEEKLILEIKQLNHRGIQNRPTTVRLNPISKMDMIQSDLHRDMQRLAEMTNPEEIKRLDDFYSSFDFE